MFWESTKNVSVRKMKSEIIRTFGKWETYHFASDKLWEPCTFVGKWLEMRIWEMVGDEDLE